MSKLKLEHGLAAVEPLRRAVNLEPHFVEAWIALAEVRASGTASQLPMLITNKPKFGQPERRFREQNESN